MSWLISQLAQLATVRSALEIQVLPPHLRSAGVQGTPTSLFDASLALAHFTLRTVTFEDDGPNASNLWPRLESLDVALPFPGQIAGNVDLTHSRPNCRRNTGISHKSTTHEDNASPLPRAFKCHLESHCRTPHQGALKSLQIELGLSISDPTHFSQYVSKL